MRRKEYFFTILSIYPKPGFQKAYTLRNRVSFTRYFDKLKWNGSAVIYYPEYDKSTTYSYDIHGNVDTLLHNYRSGLMAQQGTVL